MVLPRRLGRCSVKHGEFIEYLRLPKISDERYEQYSFNLSLVAARIAVVSLVKLMALLEPIATIELFESIQVQNFTTCGKSVNKLRWHCLSQIVNSLEQDFYNL